MSFISNFSLDRNQEAVGLRATVRFAAELIRPRFGRLVLGFVLMLIDRMAGLVLPYSLKSLVDVIVLKNKIQYLKPLFLIIVVSIAVRGVATFLVSTLLSGAAERLIAELRQKVQSHIGRLPVAFYDSTTIGNLVSRIMNDVEGIRNVIGERLVKLASGVITGCLTIIVLFHISWSLTLFCLCFLLCFAIAIKKAFKEITPIYLERGGVTAQVTGRLSESLGGARVVKAYNAEGRESVAFRKGISAILQLDLRALRVNTILNLSANQLLGMMEALVMLLGIYHIRSGALSIGGFFTFILLLGFLQSPVIDLVSMSDEFADAVAGLQRTQEILRVEPEDQDPLRVRRLGIVQGQVQFVGVRFSYNRKSPALIDVSFDAEPGMTTALVGPSGSGKSTTIGLISAFYVPTAGRILVDGYDLRTIGLDSYRSQLGAVLQESFLFDGTILDNVAFSKPTAGQKAIVRACQIAHVNEFAERFPDGLDTIVGERGVKLSSGQRQRISIARAILAEPRILILDEATSSLDSESEAFIQEGLFFLMQGRTTFVIAHRLSTVRRAEQILVLENGRITERGRHEALMALGGRYHSFYTRQQGAESHRVIPSSEGDSEVPIGR